MPRKPILGRNKRNQPKEEDFTETHCRVAFSRLLNKIVKCVAPNEV